MPTASAASPSSVSPEVASLRRRHAGASQLPLAVLLCLTCAVLLPPSTARAQDMPQRRGPSEIHDEHVLAQPRLTLPATAPWTTAVGHWTFGASVLWSNSFSWEQDVPGEDPGHRSFLVDGETLTLDASVSRGLRRNLDVALRLPLRWRGGGVIDGLIDWWHRVVRLPRRRPALLPARTPSASRARRRSGGPSPGPTRRARASAPSSSPRTGASSTRARHAPSLALVGRVSLPTGSGPLPGPRGRRPGASSSSRHRSARVRPLRRRSASTVQGRGPVRGVEYEALRGHGFVAVEWRPWRRRQPRRRDRRREPPGREHRPLPRHPLDAERDRPRSTSARRTRLDLGFTENIMEPAARRPTSRSTTALALRP